jgi:hypothetical protein
MAPDSKGDMIRWTVEWSSGGLLSRDGINATTLREGDLVKVIGYPGRNEADHRLRMQSIARASDGFAWKGTVE